MRNKPLGLKRPRAGCPASPAPSIIKAAREAVGLSQTAAARLIYKSMRVWQMWEAGDRNMDVAFWELFCLKAGVSEEALAALA